MEGVGFEPNESAHRYIATQLGVDPESEKELQDRIESYNLLQSDLAGSYLEAAKKERSIRQNALYIINGWNEHQEERNTESISRLLLRKSSHQSCGFYLRWNGLGIVVNPGHCFLKNFHRQGFHIKDINFVIVTKNTPEYHGDIQRIYDLNYQLNKLNPELQIIHYYLSQPTYQDLAHSLKPNFKQERNTVHNLELFLDSPDVEQEHLADGIILNYFNANGKEGSIKLAQSDCLGIRFDLSSNRHGAIKLAYVSGGPWSPLLSHHIGPCNILLAGFGRTNSNDCGKLHYNEDCLGYFGTYTLLEELKPKLLLCGEFDGWDGDIRLEAIKKLRKESSEQNKGSTTVLPYDSGCAVDLNQLMIECSISRSLLQAQDVRVMRTHDAFGSLKYLSQKCLM